MTKQKPQLVQKQNAKSRSVFFRENARLNATPQKKCKKPPNKGARVVRAEKKQSNDTPKIAYLCRIFQVSAGLSQKLRTCGFFDQPRKFQTNVKQNKALAEYALKHGFKAVQLHRFLDMHDVETTKAMGKLEVSLRVVSELLPPLWSRMTEGEQEEVKEQLTHQCEIAFTAAEKPTAYK